jgi:hypothetical protein
LPFFVGSTLGVVSGTNIGGIWVLPLATLFWDVSRWPFVCARGVGRASVRNTIKKYCIHVGSAACIGFVLAASIATYTVVWECPLVVAVECDAEMESEARYWARDGNLSSGNGCGGGGNGLRVRNSSF